MKLIEFMSKYNLSIEDKNKISELDGEIIAFKTIEREGIGKDITIDNYLVIKNQKGLFSLGIYLFIDYKKQTEISIDHLDNYLSKHPKDKTFSNMDKIYNYENFIKYKCLMLL